MRKLLFGMVVLVLSTAANAETWYVSTLASYHYNTEKKYEQQNYGVGIEHRLTEHFGIVAGGYRNSNRRDSLYLGVAWAPIQLYGPLRLGVAGMVVSGYETAKNTELLKAAFPFFSVEYKGYGINIPIIPPVSGTTPGVVGLQVKVRF